MDADTKIVVTARDVSKVGRPMSLSQNMPLTSRITDGFNNPKYY